MQEAHQRGARGRLGKSARVPGQRFRRGERISAREHRNAASGTTGMPVSTLHCVACGAEFVDSRPSLADGDEARCPKCGARHAFTPEFADALRRREAENGTDAPVVHGELDLKKPD
jgi:DNA-directed RNA polymerase subunit RPC12/RpoP